MQLFFNSTQLNFIVTYLQLNSWIAKYSSIMLTLEFKLKDIQFSAIHRGSECSCIYMH